MAQQPAFCVQPAETGEATDAYRDAVLARLEAIEKRLAEAERTKD